MMYATDKELNMLDKATAEFARKELAPDREENDKYPFGPFFHEVIQKAFDIDLFHSILPESLRGIGQGITAFCIILDNICQEDSSLGGIIFTNTAAQEIILAAEHNDILEKIIQNADKAEDFLIAFQSYNNPSEIRPKTRAAERNGKYLISGSIEYVVIGSFTAHGLIPAVIDGQRNYSFFLIDLSTEQVIKSDPILSLGLHACPAIDIELDHAEGVLIGKLGKGHVYFRKMSEKMQVGAAAMSAGIMKGSFKEALNYSKNRFQGGQKIINWFEMQMMLADMAVKIKIADMCVSRSCQAIEKNERVWVECSHASAIHVQASACDLTIDGIQALGGVGYMKDFGQEKRFRDAKQIQALLGLVPMKKIKYFRRITEKN
mmetsp:Transcript_21743/g.10193  ORF Transcript_21743/g.10193 Transcript_21743/m.10193 type:complete len:376 (-) Transcript_21743:1911-3038(-)